VAPAADPTFLVLHALRLKGFADASVIAGLARLDESEATAHLETAAAEKLTTHREGRISGWSLTPAGRQRHRELIVKELDDAGTRDGVESAYRKFLAVNNELLEVCTAWQVRNGVPNDHTDPTYDKGVIGRLGGIDDAVQPVCSDLAVALPRFVDYGPRLRAARERIENGEHDWFTRPMIDSYHTVWFELHEDLLATLGIERSKEVTG
jgi:hypothetical protein